MAEYIEREALLKVLRGSAVAKYPASFAMGLFAAADEVSKLPAADVAPVVHGRWILNKHYGDYECSVCKQGDVTIVHRDLLKLNYCPNCGAHTKDGE
jgi:hypothetical protein